MRFRGTGCRIHRLSWSLQGVEMVCEMVCEMVLRRTVFVTAAGMETSYDFVPATSVTTIVVIL